MFSYVLEYCTFYVNVYDFFFFFLKVSQII